MNRPQLTSTDSQTPAADAPRQLHKKATFRATSLLLLATAAAGALLSTPSAQAQLPSPTYGWNLGNTLDATWTGAPQPTQAMINAVAAAGFNTIRIPCAWDHNADPNTHQINASFMATVTQTVQWAQAANLTVIINDHWDGGWFEDSNFNSFDSTVNSKLVSYWTQIANNFKGYSSKVLFACANEPNVTTAAQTTVLFQYYQSFVNAVRNTGGNNSTRMLIIQGPGGANIDNSNSWVTSLPSDPAGSGHLAFEVHYYAPYQYALMNADASWGLQWYFWGSGYHSSTLTTRNSTSAWEESYVDSELQLMYNKFSSKGVPVLMGEFGAIRRSSTLSGNDLNLHLASRTYFDKYIVAKANSLGIRPVYWDDADNGSGNNAFGIFNRSTAALTRPDDARALTGGAALPPPGSGGSIPNGTYKIINLNSGEALDVTGNGTANGTNVEQWTYSGGNNQRWVLTSLGNNVYTIVGVQSGRALDVAGAGTANGTNVDIWDSNGGNNQHWQITATSNGYYRVTPMNATGSCLDVNGASKTAGANVQIWTYGGGANQQWTFQAP